MGTKKKETLRFFRNNNNGRRKERTEELIPCSPLHKITKGIVQATISTAQVGRTRWKHWVYPTLACTNTNTTNSWKIGLLRSTQTIQNWSAAKSKTACVVSRLVVSHADILRNLLAYGLHTVGPSYIFHRKIRHCCPVRTDSLPEPQYLIVFVFGYGMMGTSHPVSIPFSPLLEIRPTLRRPHIRLVSVRLAPA